MEYSRPSIDVLFASAAESHRERCVGVVLTGANADGAAGLARIVDLGGIRVALDDMSATRLDGAVIRYDAEEEGYLLDHPDAVTAVWCG